MLTQIQRSANKESLQGLVRKLTRCLWIVPPNIESS